MIRCKLLVILSLCSSLIMAQLPDTLDLQMLLEIGQERALELSLAQLTKTEIEHNYKIYQSGLRPSLSAYVNLPNFIRTSTPVIQPNGSIQFQTIRYDNSNFGLSLEQNIAETGGTVFVDGNVQRFEDFENEFIQYNGMPLSIGLRQPLFMFNPFK